MTQRPQSGISARALVIAAVCASVALIVLAPPGAELARGAMPAQPTATSTGVIPPPFATATLPLPFPTATTAAPSNVCPQVVKRVPAAAISSALSNPSSVAGYNKPANPARPEGPMNPLRTWLSIHVYAKPYHPLYNGLEFKAGCP